MDLFKKLNDFILTITSRNENFWEQRELNKTNDVRDGTHDTPKYIDSGYPLITSKNLTSSGTINFDDISYISEDDFNFINKRSNVDTNDILFGMIGTIGNPVLVGNDTNFAIKNVALIKKSDSINQYFLINILNSNIFKKYIIKTNQGNTQKFISLSQIRKFTFYAPQLYEQIEIGKILQKIDSVITLYDRKLKLLSQIKKYFLDNLFAKKEYPNLRFKGFTDAWEQRKLNEVATRVLRKNKNLISKRPLTISAQYGLIDQQAFFNKQVASSNLENYLLLEKGEFAYNKSYSDGFPYGTIKKLNLYDNGAVSTLYIAFKANADINSDFLENLFSSNKWNNEVYKIAAEGARNHGLLNISPDDFFNIKITISKDSQEQVFISKFLKVFDNLLALYENKQNYLTEIKNTLLNTMFI